MKLYPSISGPMKAPRKPCIAFKKYDGSNIRFEWSPKKGWHKYGTRKRLFDETDDVFAPAIGLFHDHLADDILRIVRDNRKWRDTRRITAYTEFFGPYSFAGLHDWKPNNEPLELALFDVNIHQKGLVSPRDFINHFGDQSWAAEVVYEGNLNDELIAGVRRGDYNTDDGIEEGVVCKGGSGHGLWMVKIKTTAYLEKLKLVFGNEWEQYGE